MMFKRGVLGLLALALIAPSGASAAAGAASGDGVQPVEVAGNQPCPAGLFELKVEPPEDGTYTLGGFSVVVDVRSTGTGEVFDFDANMGVDRVLVKGGPNTNTYVYAPEDDADTGLHAPLGAGPGGTRYHDLSHISFCLDFELQVAKTATTTFTREYDWTIDKSNDVEGTTVQLSPGQQYTVNYDVVASVLGSTDSDHAVSGTITVTNPAHVPASVTGVNDVISGTPAIAAAVDCNGSAAGDGLPATVASGGVLQCAYASALPDGSSRTNTATAVSNTTGINNGSGTAPVTFGDPSAEIDECVTVSDDKTDPLNPVTLGTVCRADAPQTFSYSLTFGPFANVCATHSFTNTAGFETNDEGDTGSDTSVATFEVQCVAGGGCTLTQGYWKTHSRQGPAPYDDSWQNLGADEENTLFLNTQVSWHDVFWMAPQGGNAFLILAHQYQAAVLNQLDGASVPADVAAAMTAAAGLLDDYTSIPAAKSIPKAKRDQMIALAGTLGSYNEGSTGPGHCDEDDLSSSSA